MLPRLKKRRLRYKYYIVLNGTHDVPIIGMTGISLKEVDYAAVKKHKGLRYWVAFELLRHQKHSKEEIVRQLSLSARVDIMSLIMGQKAERIGAIKF